MAYTKVGLVFVVLLMSPVTARGHCDVDWDGRSHDCRKESSRGGSSWWKAGAALATGALAVVAAPVVVPLLGFGAGDIAAGSLAAGAMSTAATTGVGMGVVSTLQAIGAAGVLTATQTAVVGGATAAGMYKGVCMLAAIMGGLVTVAMLRLFRDAHHMILFCAGGLLAASVSLAFCSIFSGPFSFSY